jgi:hypothetical protein
MTIKSELTAVRREIKALTDKVDEILKDGGGPQKLDNVLSSESVQNRKELTNGQKTEKVQFRV